MTGVMPIVAVDDLDAKTVAERMSDIQLVQFSKVDAAQVIATREIK